MIPILQIINAMKRRVGAQGSHRESRRVRRDMERRSEHGLGAAHRLWRVNADCNVACLCHTGCDGCTRYSAGLSVYHFTPAVGEASAGRQR